MKLKQTRCKIVQKQLEIIKSTILKIKLFNALKTLSIRFLQQVAHFPWTTQ